MPARHEPGQPNTDPVLINSQNPAASKGEALCEKTKRSWFAKQKTMTALFFI